MQGLTELTLQSNMAANELINLEEKEEMAKIRSRVRHNGERWHVAMAARGSCESNEVHIETHMKVARQASQRQRKRKV